MTSSARTGIRVLAAVLVLAGAAAYLIRAQAIRHDLRDGRAAYQVVCERITRSAEVSGSPGSIAHLVSAMRLELDALAARYPRWYESYRKDPSAYPCGPQEPNTQVGSDR